MGPLICSCIEPIQRLWEKINREIILLKRSFLTWNVSHMLVFSKFFLLKLISLLRIWFTQNLYHPFPFYTTQILLGTFKIIRIQTFSIIFSYCKSSWHMRGDDPYQIRRTILVVLLILLYNLLFRRNSLIAYLFQWYLYLFKLHYR